MTMHATLFKMRPIQADPFIISSGSFACGLLASASSLPGNQSPAACPYLRPHNGCFQLWMWVVVHVQLLIGEWHLVQRSCLSPCELPEAGHCFPRLAEISNVAVWNACPIIQSDSTTMMMNRMGGTRPRTLDRLAQEIILSDLQHFSDNSSYFRLRQCWRWIVFE